MLYVPSLTAVVEACFIVVVTYPRYSARTIPCSFINVVVACSGPLNRLSCLASSIKAVLMRSVGVTANVLATMPELIPASRLLSGLNVPVSGSLNCALIVSNEMKRMPSFRMVPATRVEQPLYSDLGPSFSMTDLMTANGFRVGVVSWSWTLVLANSKAAGESVRTFSFFDMPPQARHATLHSTVQINLRYVMVASTPPAAPPAIRETSGDLFEAW
jgi:hypothetical protein